VVSTAHYMWSTKVSRVHPQVSRAIAEENTLQRSIADSLVRPFRFRTFWPRILSANVAGPGHVCKLSLLLL